MRAKTILLIAVPVVLILGLVVWRITAKRSADAQLQRAQKARAGAPMPVKLAEAKPAVILNTLDLQGEIESPYVVKLSAKTTGRIDSLVVREGDKVQPGQVLVKLDPTAVEGEILSSQSSLAAAKARLAQAVLTQSSNNAGVTAQVTKDRASLTSTVADYNQTNSSSAQQIAASDAAVTDGQAKVASAESQLASSQADLSSSQASQANAKAKFDRMQTLYNQGFAAAQDVDDARTAYSVAEAGVNSSQNKVRAAQSAVRSAKAQLDSAKRQASITRNKAKSDVAAAQARLDQAKATLTVSNANTSQIGAYEANLSALREAVAAAQGQLAQSLSKRSDTQLTSAIEGVVTSRAMDPGTVATAGQAILTVQFLKWLFVTVPVPIESSSRVHVGDSVNFKVDGIESQFSARVAEINPAADPTSRQFTIRLKIDNSDNVLRPGMFAHVQLQTNRVEAAVTAPREAVTTDNSGVSKVFVVDSEGKAKLTTVQTGAQSSTTVELKSGVEVGQKLVILSTRQPRDGQAVVDADKAAKEGSTASGEGQSRRSSGRSRGGQ